MSKQKFTDILNKRIKENALTYLKGKRKSKGKEIKYEELEMAEYLGPTNIILTIEEKQKLFGIRNRMVNLPINFPKSKIKPKCICGETEEMEHIVKCENWNETVNTSEKYDDIYNGDIK